MLGALLTGYQAQRLAGQGDLIPAISPGFPELQAIAAQGQAGVLFVYNQVQLRVFGLALGNIFLLIAGLTAIGVLLALLLPQRQERSGAAHVVVIE